MGCNVMRLSPGALGMLAALAALAACGGGDDGVSTSDAHDGGDTGVSVEAWASAVDGRTVQGVYLCCAPGEARDACCPPATLPDPEHGRSATCFVYGGVAGDCAAAGGVVEAKDICATCCEGLTRIAISELVDGTCQETGPPSLLLCTACGDSRCADGETSCNCAADCPAP